MALALWIAVDDFWLYPTVSGWSGDFKWWLAVGLSVNAIAIIISGYTSISTLSTDKQIVKGSHGFSPIQQYRLVDLENTDFIDKLIDKLKNTDVSETAFSLGIVGEWGSGKTVFLNSIRARVEKCANETVIVFNPWLGMTNQSLVQSFFSTLSEKIREDTAIEIESPLKEYADALVAIEGEGGFISKALSIFGIRKDKSLFELKQSISETLKNSQRNIYILIDDLDRLSGEELFEVLRLIRITADFPHLFYVAAYDRTYVQSALASYGIDQSKRYLDKIFNVEFTLPKASSTQLSSLFKEEIKTVDSFLDESTVENWTKWAIEYLPTFRDIKRFVREYSLIESHMENHLTDDEYTKQDLFLLELLKYYDIDLYKKLSDDPEKVLKFELNFNGAFWFDVSQNEDSDLHIMYKSQQLLQKLFKNDKPDPRSIKYLANFQRYFTYRLRSNEIRRIDFNLWKNADDNKAKTIFSSMKQQAADSLSLLFHLSLLSGENLTTLKLKDISVYLLSFCLDSDNRAKSARKILYSLLHEAFSNRDHVDIDAYFEWLGKFLANSDLSFSSIGKLLKLIRTNSYDAIDKIRSIEISNLKKFLKTVKPNAAEIAHHGSTLHEIYSASIDWSLAYLTNQKGDETSHNEGYTALFEPLIEYFQENPSDLKCRQDLYETMFCFEDIDESGEKYMDEIIDEDAYEEAVRIFGSYDNYKKYYEKAFKAK
ncbi:MAG: KAP family NTPase [Muribaculaceae bacterium]|nr:KAP family NTPase [Muribaculaceae bacterium]